MHTNAEMIGNFCISDIALVWRFILSIGIHCTRTGVLCGYKSTDRVWCCKNKIQIFMILIDADMCWLQHDNASYRIFDSMKTMIITSKFDIKSGLFQTEVYYDDKQPNFKISNWINDLLFLTLPCARTAKYKVFS